MSTFALDRNYQQFNFEEISVKELEIISGGSGGWWGATIAESFMYGAGLGGTVGAIGGAVATGASAGATSYGYIGLALGGAFGFGYGVGTVGYNAFSSAYY